MVKFSHGDASVPRAGNYLSQGVRGVIGAVEKMVEFANQNLSRPKCCPPAQAALPPALSHATPSNTSSMAKTGKSKAKKTKAFLKAGLLDGQIKNRHKARDFKQKVQGRAVKRNKGYAGKKGEEEEEEEEVDEDAPMPAKDDDSDSDEELGLDAVLDGEGVDEVSSAFVPSAVSIRIRGKMRRNLVEMKARSRATRQKVAAAAAPSESQELGSFARSDQPMGLRGLAEAG